MPVLPKFPLKMFAALYMIAAMGALAVTINNAATTVSGEAAEPSKFFIGAWLALYGLTLGCIPLIRWRFNSGDLLVIGIALFFALSTVWSHIPSNSSKYSFSLVMNAIAALTISRIIPREQFPKFLAGLIVFVAIVSIALWGIGYQNVIWVDPHARLTIFHTAPIKGLFFHKIPAGIYSAMGFWLSILVLNGWRRITASLICLIFDGLTGSSIGLALLPVGFLFLMLINFSRSGRLDRTTFFTLLGMTLLSGVGFFYIFGADILALLDRDPTLTGRTLLWSWGLETAWERPFLGWGFFGYFGSTEAMMAAQRITVFRNYDVPHFHNSYIQMLVEIGIIPAMILFWIIFQTMGRWYRNYIRLGQSHDIAFYLITIMIIFLGGFSLVFIRYNDISTLLIFISISYAFRRMPQRNVAAELQAHLATRAERQA